MATEITDDPVHAAIPARDDAATALDRSEDNSTQSLYRAALGNSQTDFYCKVFARFDAVDRAGISWNWSAALLTLNWFAFRQLWGAALAYAGAIVSAVLLVFGIGRLVYQTSAETETALLLALLALSVIVPGLFGNALLYKQCRKRMQAALSSNTTLPEACAVLQKQSSSRRRLILLALANALLAAGLGALAWSLPEWEALPLHSEKMAAARSLPASAAASAPTLASAASAPAAPVAEAAKSSASASGSASGPVAAAAAAASSSSQPAETVAPGKAMAAGRVLEPQPGQGLRGVPTAASEQPAAEPKPAPTAAAAKAEKLAKAEKPAKAEKTAKPEKAEKPAVAAKPAKADGNTKVAKEKTSQGKAAARVAAEAKPDQAAAEQNSAYMINVGLFAEDNNALNAFTKLKDAGLPALTQVLNTAKGKRTRVRVGPFETQAEADAAADKIHALQLDAVVFRR